MVNKKNFVLDSQENIFLEKEKILDTSIFSYFENVFKSLLLQGCENQGSFGKGLKYTAYI